MPFISITRLRIRSIRFMPLFALYTWRTLQQVKAAEGFQGGGLLPDGTRTFWTMTMWDSQESMRRYMLAGSHKAAMPKLMAWCDEASVVHWDQESAALPSWPEADARMRSIGRISKVRNPSPNHADLSYAIPRTSAGGKIAPRQRTGASKAER